MTSVAPAVEVPSAPSPPVSAEKPPVEAWEEAEEAAEEEVTPAALTGAQLSAVAGRRDALEMMFETMRAGLEGVYVEEVDTPAGAGADAAKSYTDLVSQLNRQLVETLGQARSGLRFALSNGSLRSLDDALLDAYRRLCRLLFRAVGAGAISQEAEGLGQARLLVACRRESPLFETLSAITHQTSDWHAFVVAERFRQLPIMTRLYGPSHLVLEVGRNSALWDQVKLVRSMPEGRRIQIVGVRSCDDKSAAPDAGLLKELSIETVLDDGPDLLVALRERISPRSADRPGADAEKMGATVDAVAV